MDDSNPTVIVVEDDNSVRKALALLLKSIGLDVKTYESGAQFLDEFHPALHGCLVLDLRMPKMSGLEVQEEMLRRGINLPVVFITGHGDVKVAVQALKRGAIDFVEKPFSDQLLLDAVQRAIALDAEMRGRRASVADIETRLKSLTPRESEIMMMVVAGKASKQIAVELEISQKTVEVHRSHIMKKLDASCVADLVRMVLTAKSIQDDTSGAKSDVEADRPSGADRRNPPSRSEQTIQG